MKARALRQLAQKNGPTRMSLVAEGLGLLAENARKLAASADVLKCDDHVRGAAILENQAAEESAKALILLDLARRGVSDDAALKSTCGHFYDHLARLIYIAATDLRPGGFSDLLAHVARMRKSHYLDGPNDVDWIFRNELIDGRESAMYVDLVERESELTWIAPSDWPGLGSQRHPDSVRLTETLSRAGLFTVSGLVALAEVWRDVPPAGSLTVPGLKDLNRKALSHDAVQSGQMPGLSEVALGHAVDAWTYPLVNEDLTRVDVDGAELDRQRSDWSSE